MLIKLKGVHDDKLGSKDAKRIEGVRLDNGEPWERKIFADARDIRGQLDKFGMGENIDVKMKQDGKWWNIVALEKPSDALIEKVTSGGGFSGGGGGGSSNYQKAAPAKSTWNGRTGDAYDRSAAIYLALDFLKTNATAPIKAERMYAMAEDVFNYIHSGINPTVDPLEPPV